MLVGSAGAAVEGWLCVCDLEIVGGPGVVFLEGMKPARRMATAGENLGRMLKGGSGLGVVVSVSSGE